MHEWPFGTHNPPQGLVSYQYTVGERTFNGDRVGFGTVVGDEKSAQSLVDRYRFGTVVGDEKSAQSLVDRYRPGQQVPIHVNPEDPQSTVLEPRLLSNEVYWVAPRHGPQLAVPGMAVAQAAQAKPMTSVSSA